MIDRFLEDLENRIDLEVEDDLYSRWKTFTDGRFTGNIFQPDRLRPSPPRVDWPKASTNQAFHDPEMMLLQQFGNCSRMLAQGSGSIMNVRANYGTSILPSLFGVRLFLMDDALDTLPTSWPVDGGVDAIRSLVDRGVPDVDTELGAKVLQMGRRFMEAMAPYPKIRKYVHIYHPDLQGPMDVCEVIWGSGIFLDLVDHPDLVKAFLDVVTDAYSRLMKAWDAIVGPNIEGPDGADYSVHWEMLHRGHIMLRDDSAMNLSPAMFDEFVKPYDQRLLDEFGGGGVHFCGRGEHFIASMCGMRRLYAVTMSQPEYNDMEIIYRNTVDKGIRLIGCRPWATERDSAAGRVFPGGVHCYPPG